MSDQGTLIDWLYAEARRASSEERAINFAGAAVALGTLAETDEHGDLRSVPTEKLTAMRERCERLEAGLGRIADADVPRVEFAEDDLISEFAQEVLDNARKIPT